MVIRVLIASKNPVKISAARESFLHFHKNPSFSILDLDELNTEADHLKSQPVV